MGLLTDRSYDVACRSSTRALDSHGVPLHAAPAVHWVADLLHSPCDGSGSPASLPPLALPCTMPPGWPGSAAPVSPRLAVRTLPPIQSFAVRHLSVPRSYQVTG